MAGAITTRAGVTGCAGKGIHAELIARRFEAAARRLGLDRAVPALRCDLFAVPPKAGDQLSLF